MADNMSVSGGSGHTIALDEVVDPTLGTVKVQFVKLMDGTLDSTTKGVIGANGMYVEQRVAAADPFGLIADAVVAAGATGSISAKLRRATQGLEDLKTGIILASGSNVFGKLGANSGTIIGDVNVTTLPADPLGANADAIVGAGAAGSISAKLRRTTQGLEDLKTSIVLAAGANAIGKLAANSGIDIGDVDVTSIIAGTGATNIGKAIDNPVGATDTGVGVLFKRVSTPAGITPANGDYAPGQLDDNGNIRVNVTAGGVQSGAAGTPSTDVMSIQGIASMRPVDVQSSTSAPVVGVSPMLTISVDVTRPADTTPYNANDVWSNSTSAPTSGGYTFTGAGRVSGGSGVITDIMFVSSAVPGTLLQGELHIFNQAATNVNDNSTWALSDSDAKNRIAVVPFTLLADANNSYYHAQNLNIGYTCVGSADLRFLYKVKNAYTPISAEVLTAICKCMQVN